jgi:hypothetical protein
MHGWYLARSHGSRKPGAGSQDGDDTLMRDGVGDEMTLGATCVPVGEEAGSGKLRHVLQGGGDTLGTEIWPSQGGSSQGRFFPFGRVSRTNFSFLFYVLVFPGAFFAISGARRVCYYFKYFTYEQLVTLGRGG